MLEKSLGLHDKITDQQSLYTSYAVFFITHSPATDRDHAHFLFYHLNALLKSNEGYLYTIRYIIIQKILCLIVLM
jgi:hypothetical protein